MLYISNNPLLKLSYTQWKSECERERELIFISFAVGKVDGAKAPRRQYMHVFMWRREINRKNDENIMMKIYAHTCILNSDVYTVYIYTCICALCMSMCTESSCSCKISKVTTSIPGKDLLFFSVRLSDKDYA